jgi:hypothetical protein
MIAAVRRYVALVVADARAGTVLVTGAVSAMVSVATAVLISSSEFLPGWADPLNAGLTTTLYIAPIAAGAAALHSRDSVSRGIIELASTTPRGWRAATRLGWSSVTASQLAAFCLGVSFLLLLSDLDGPFSPAMILLPLSGMVVVALASMVGTLAGRFWPHWLAAPLLAMVVFATIFAASLAGGRASVVSVIFPGTFYQTYLEPNVGLVSGQLLGVSSIALLGMSLLSRARTALIVAACGTVALLGSVSTLRGIPLDPVQFRTAPARATCMSAGAVSLCVWPESRAVLRPGLEALRDVVAAASPVLDLPHEYHQPGLDVPHGSRVYFVPPYPDVRESFIFTAVRAAVPPTPCTDREAEDAQYEVTLWLEARVLRDGSYPPEVQQALAESDAAQRAWVRQRIERARACSG